MFFIVTGFSYSDSGILASVSARLRVLTNTG